MHQMMVKDEYGEKDEVWLQTFVYIVCKRKWENAK
jgi:hypothetical protein